MNFMGIGQKANTHFRIKLNFLLFAFVLVSVENVASAIDKTKVKNIREYYRLINDAELLIIDSNFIEAKNKYIESFHSNAPFAKDIYNAFLCSYYTRDTLFAIDLINNLAYHGLNKSRFFDTLIDPMFFKYIFKEFDSCYNAGLINSNQKMIQIIDSMYFEDVKTREMINYADFIEKVDSVNINKLILLLKSNGWPTYEQVGLWCYDSNPIMDNFPLLLILHHNRYKTNKYDSLLIKEIFAGNMRSDHYATVIFYRNSFKEKYFKDYNLFLNIWQLELLNTSQRKIANYNRKKIYLDNLIDYNRKFQFQYINNKNWGASLQKSSFKFLNNFLIPSPDQFYIFE